MNRFIRVAGLTAAFALGAASSAQAHPGWYSVDAKVAFTYEEQTVNVTGGAGTFKPSANASSVAFDATAPQVEAALWADPAIGYDNVDVNGPAGGPYVIRYTGTLAGADVPLVAPAGAGGATAVASQGPQGHTPVTFASDPDGHTMATVKQYVLVNDGYTYGYTETNKLGGRGMLNLKVLPGAYRAAPMPLTSWITYPAAATGIQPHATCTGVPALDDPVNILTSKTGDPFYGYIPWQNTSAGIGDHPEQWIPAVKTITNGMPGAPAGGVDLSALSTVADFTAACSAIGGTYFPADTRSTTASALVSDAVAPLNAQITALNAQIATLTSARDAALADKTTAEDAAAAAKAAQTTAESKLATSETARIAAEQSLTTERAAKMTALAEVSRLLLQTRRLTLTVEKAVNLDGSNTVKVSGPALAPVLVRLVLTQAAATKLKLGSRVLAAAKGTIGADGTTSVTLAIAKKSLRTAAKKASKKAIGLDATSADRFATAAAFT